MATVAGLISDFHNLQGDTLQEKHKSFQHLLATIKENIQNKTHENELITNLEPSSNLEYLFKIDLLLHLKRNNELLEVLKSGNREHIGRILKNFDFFMEIMPNISADTLINDLFPQTSYVIKKKITNRIYKTVKNEELVDTYFMAIEEKYGLTMAFGILPGCSTSLIRLKVKKYIPKLSSRHVIEICKKDSTFPSFYFGILKKNDDTFDIFKQYNCVIQYFAKKDIQLFWNLQKEFNFDFKCGKHLTKKLLLQNQDVLKNGSKCIEWFHTIKLYSTIIQQDKMENFLLSFFQDTPMEFLEKHLQPSSNINEILTLLSPTKRYALIKDIFQKKYSKDILDYQMLLSQHFLELMPIHAREPIVKKHLEKSDDYTYLLKSNEAIPLLKTMLQNCSKSAHRAKIVRELCRMLKMNKDKQAVEQMIEFMFERYHNDIQSLTNFTTELGEWKDLEDLNEEHLKLLYQLALVTKPRYGFRQSIHKIFYAHIYYLIKHGMPFEDHLIEYIKTISSEYEWYLEIYQGDCKYKNLILNKVLDLADYFKDHDKSYKSLINGLIVHIHDYNTNRKSNLIPLSKYKQYFEQVLQDNGTSSAYLELYHCIKKYKEEELHTCFWTHFDDAYTNATYREKMLAWYFKNDIKQVEEHIEKVLSCCETDPSDSLRKAVKKYSTLTIQKKIITYSESKVSFDDPITSSSLINLLCCADSEGFLKVTAPFMPPANGKLDGEKILNKRSIYQAVIYSLAEIDLKDVLDIVRTVCIGDYLKYGLKPLYKILYNTKESHVLQFLKDLKQSAVSVRKHSLLLSRHLLPINDALMFIDEALQDEQNDSMKNVIFTKTFHLFIETQTDNVWKVLHKYFSIANSDDPAMLNFMVNCVKKIPPMYVTDYLQSTYDALNKSKSKELGKKVTSLAKNIPQKAINSISYDVLEKIFHEMLKGIFIHGCDEECHWDPIFYLYIDKSKQLICSAMEYVKTVTSHVSNGYNKDRIPLNNFLRPFCKTALNHKSKEYKEVIETFYMQCAFLPRYCLIDSFILLKITLAYYQSMFDLKEFAALLSTLLHLGVEEYDPSIILNFYNQLNILCELCGLKDDNLYILADEILKCNDHKYNYILTIMLLPKIVFPAEDNEYHKWVSIIKAIEKFSKKGKDSTSVMMYYDNYLQEHRKEYLWVGYQ